MCNADGTPSTEGIFVQPMLSSFVQFISVQLHPGASETRVHYV